MRTRNRRIAYVISIVSGSFVGAFIQRYNGTNLVVLLGVILKAIVTIWIACLPGLRDPSVRLRFIDVLGLTGLIDD
jgi:hypothetical protein